MTPTTPFISGRAQTIMIWWGLIFMFIFGFSLWLLLGMAPPPPPTLSPTEVAAFYLQNNVQIKLGAVVTSYTSAFVVPYMVVIGVQMMRLEKGIPVWSILQLVGGALMSIFLVLPGLFWGIAAYSPMRNPEVTALMHEIGTLTLVTTDQFFIFQMIAITYVSLTQTIDKVSAFPRWYGWLTLWIAIAFEVGAIAFIPKTGPFAWNGAVVFWMPFILFGVWITVTSVCMLAAIKRQRLAGTA